MADNARARAGYDLHTHSVYSDGTTRPADIAAEAAALGLAGFALTDHDTVDGWDEARIAAESLGIDFLPGIEITTKFAGSSRHLLAYGIATGDDPAAVRLNAALDRVRGSRLNRARRMVERLSVDFRLEWDDVLGGNDVRTVGRPHIADALVSHGYFADRSTAFLEVLHPGSPYYLSTYAIPTDEAIALVRAAGGVSVLAHPAAARQRAAVSEQDLQTFAAAGLWGIELDHPENRGDWLPKLRKAAARLGLEVTGSSDYHGMGKPNRLGECTTPAQVVTSLRAAVTTPR